MEKGQIKPWPLDTKFDPEMLKSGKEILEDMENTVQAEKKNQLTEKERAYKIMQETFDTWFTERELEEHGINDAMRYFVDAVARAESAEEAIARYDKQIQDLQNEVDSEREAKEWFEELVKAQRKRFHEAGLEPEYDYRVIRTYDVGTETENLDEYFKSGYEFVHASEFVQATYNGKNYIEYIVRKKRQQV